MKWVPVSILALIIAFSNASLERLGIAVIICILSFAYAVHFDNQIMKFLSAVVQWYRRQ